MFEYVSIPGSNGNEYYNDDEPRQYKCNCSHKWILKNNRLICSRCGEPLEIKNINFDIVDIRQNGISEILKKIMDEGMDKETVEDLKEFIDSEERVLKEFWDKLHEVTKTMLIEKLRSNSQLIYKHSFYLSDANEIRCHDCDYVLIPSLDIQPQGVLYLGFPVLNLCERDSGIIIKKTFGGRIW